MSAETESTAGVVDEPRRHAVVWLVYLVLYAVAIPWYWPAGYRGPLVLGLPAWVAVTLAAIAALAGWTAFVIYRYWRTPDEDNGPRRHD